ncbi:HepT-like ribonuclease domain-containing protein [Phaeodactylibacter sp.]
MIHNYDGIDITIVWAIVKKHLPILKEAAQQGLK